MKYKIFLMFFAFVLLLSIAAAAIQTTYNPFTGKLDYYGVDSGSNFTNTNATTLLNATTSYVPYRGANSDIYLGTVKLVASIINTTARMTTSVNGEIIRALGTNESMSIRFLTIANDFYIGVEGAQAGSFFTGALGNYSVFYSTNPIQAIVNSSSIVTFTGGALGINTTSPLYMLQVQGGSAYFNASSSDVVLGNTQYAIIDANGTDLVLNPKATGAGKIYTTGDHVVQENITIGSNSYLKGFTTASKNITISGNNCLNIGGAAICYNGTSLSF